MAAISLENLTFSYPGADAPTVENLNLEIGDGEAHALLGASGTGKTTLLNLLSGLLQPTGGKIRFGTQDVAALAGRARNVAQVFQFPVLYESMTVAQNLGFALGITRARAAKAHARVNQIAQELDIEHLLDRKAQGLGLFEKQLVAVGKALVKENTALVLLDEPLTAVEPKIKWRLRQTLLKAQHDLGLTMVYVTHDQTEALTFADRVSVLTPRGIVQTGTPAEIYQSPTHEYVGHFVGSPGMNYIPAQILGLSGGDTLGFRPEWLSALPATANTAQHFAGRVMSARSQGTLAGERVGLTTLELMPTDSTPAAKLRVNLYGPIHWGQGETVPLRVNRYVLFKDQWQVGAGSFD